MLEFGFLRAEGHYCGQEPHQECDPDHQGRDVALRCQVFLDISPDHWQLDPHVAQHEQHPCEQHQHQEEGDVDVGSQGWDYVGRDHQQQADGDHEGQCQDDRHVGFHDC